MQGMGHEAGLRIPSSRAGMPLVGAGRLQLAGWWAWGLKATITHKVRYNTLAPRAHTTGIPAPGLRCRSKWHGRPNPLPGAVRAAWCPCPYACMPRPMPPMPVPWLRPCAVCIYTGEHPRGGGAMWVLALRLTKLLWCAWFLSIRLRGLAFPGWTLRMVLVRPINCFPCFLLSLSIFVIFGIDETWPVALRIATVFQRFVA